MKITVEHEIVWDDSRSAPHYRVYHEDYSLDVDLIDSELREAEEQIIKHFSECED